jgi:hypothetical protein
LWGTKSLNLFYFVNCSQTPPAYLNVTCFTWSQDGDDGMDAEKCSNCAEYAPLSHKTKSLVVMNYFPSVPTSLLTDMVNTCYTGMRGYSW